MDQLSAHLDRGWDLAQRGDAAGAEACARRALELDPEAPEVHNLLGYTAALAGEADEALEHYRQAIALDENYFEAMLNAAEVLLSMESWADAISHCDEAYELAETDEERLDCLLLKVDAQLGKGDDDGALRTLHAAPDGPYANGGHSFSVGRALYELGKSEEALPLFKEAVKAEPDHADAHYHLGLVAEEQGDLAAATFHFLRTRALDAHFPPPPWSESPEVFASTVERALDRLDPAFARHVTDAAVFVVDAPGPEVVVDGVEPRALVFLDRIDEKSLRLFVYQRNVERVARGEDSLDTEITMALEREVSTMFLQSLPEIPSTLN